MKYNELPLNSFIIKRLEELGITTPTPIQEKSIPEILAGRDIVGLAQTGTGKTFAFLLPIVHDLLKELDKNKEQQNNQNQNQNNSPRKVSVLIIAPTRELTLQTSEEAKKLLKGTGLTSTAIIGGTDYQKQIAKLKKGTDILIATPGRLLDFIGQGIADLSQVRFLVMDEADRMFDMGFIKDIKQIIKRTSAKKQTMMFSATMPYEILRLASDYMNDPVDIHIESEKITADKIKQELYHLGRNEKMPYLVNTILNEESNLILIFTNMRVHVDAITEALLRFGITARGISSLLAQNKRSRLMQDYKDGKIKVLVATDVASRGIDVDGITHVFNYDLPQDSEDFVHRIGRTARAGESGIAISFCSEFDYENLGKIEKLIGYSLPNTEVNDDYLNFPKGEFENLLKPKSKARPPRENAGRKRSSRTGAKKKKSSVSSTGSTSYKDNKNKSTSSNQSSSNKPAYKSRTNKNVQPKTEYKKTRPAENLTQNNSTPKTGQRISHVGSSSKKSFWSKVKGIFKK